MRLLTLVLLLLLPQTPRTARDYYDELYAAGGLDRMADRYVCFDEDPNLPTFFIYAESKELRELMIADGTFARMPKEMQEKLKQDWIVVRGYDKGVPVGDQDFLDKDDSTWVGGKGKIGNQCCMRIRLSVTPQTMRYKRSVEILYPNGTLKTQVSRYGKCEEVKADVHQTGR